MLGCPGCVRPYVIRDIKPRYVGSNPTSSTGYLFRKEHI